MKSEENFGKKEVKKMKNMNGRFRCLLYAYTPLDNAGGILIGLAAPVIGKAIEHRCSNLYGDHTTKVHLRPVEGTKRGGIKFLDGAMIPTAVIDDQSFSLKQMLIDKESFIKMCNGVETANKNDYQLGYLTFVANLLDFFAQAILLRKEIPVDYSASAKEKKSKPIGWEFSNYTDSRLGR